MKLSSFEWWGQPSELVDFKDEVTTILNYGKYAVQVLTEATTSPAWKGREGESVYAYSTNEDSTYTFRTYYWINSGWVYTTFIGTISDNTLQPTAPPNPTNVLITTGGHIETDGTYIPYFDVAWTAPTFATNLESYAISYSEDSGVNWVNITIVDKSETTFRWLIPDINTAYIVRVKSVGTNGEYSTGAQSSSTTHPGYSTAPALVAHFSASFTDRISFTWDANTENDISEYEIRSANANWGSGGGVQIFHGNALRYTLVTPPSRTPGTYYIKARNLSNIYSVSANSFAPTNPGPSAPSVSKYQGFGFAALEWTDVADFDLQSYNVYKSYTSLYTGEESLIEKVAGTQAYIMGHTSVICNADLADATTITDSTNLLSLPSSQIIGNVVYVTSGSTVGNSGVIGSYNSATGVVTLNDQGWSVATPAIHSRFEVRDREYLRVIGEDLYGLGTWSAIQMVDFTPLSEGEIGQGVISASSLITGNVITLGAQIRDAIITNAHINDLSVGKLTADTMAAVSMTINAGGDLRSENYVADTAGFKLDGTDGLELNSGTIFGVGVRSIGFINMGFDQYAGTGVDGTLTVTSASSIAGAGIKQYQDLTINSTHTLAAPNCVIGVAGTLTVIGTIEASTMGLPGGGYLLKTISSGEAGFNEGIGQNGYGFDSIIGGAGGGGGSGNIPDSSNWQPAGNGGNSGGKGGVSLLGVTSGLDGASCTVVNQNRNEFFMRNNYILRGMGGGGGESSFHSHGVWCAGGSGGGFLYIECDTFDFRPGAVMLAKGMTGEMNFGVEVAGGAGGGGTICVRYKNLIQNSGNLIVIGGVGSGSRIEYSSGSGGAGTGVISQVPTGGL